MQPRRSLPRLAVLAFLIVGGLLLLRGREATAAPDVSVGLGGNEPNAAAINPLNPQNVIITNCGLRFSTNFGATFPGPTVGHGTPPGYPETGFNCDDAVTFDSQGRLFWSYLISSANEAFTVVAQPVNPTTGALIGNAVAVSHAGAA